MSLTLVPFELSRVREWLGRKYLVWRHPLMVAIGRSIAMDPQLARPLMEWLRPAFVGNQYTVALVRILDFGGSPTNIVGFIASVYVYAVNAVCRRWARTNVLVERSKRFSPAIADGNSSPTIAGIGLVLWVITSTAHTNPHPIFSFFGVGNWRSGIMGLHHNLLRCGVMPWDVTASPGRSYSVLASPLYHVAEQMYTNPWPMEGRAITELGISIDGIIQQYAGR